MAKKKVGVELIFDSKGAISAIKTADGEMLKLDKTANKNVASMAKLSTAMKVGVAAAALAMAAAARKGFQVLSESVELAGVQQIAERKLEQALLNTGDASEESANQLKRLASEVQNLSNFGDEAIITAQAMLLSFGEVGGAQGAALLTPRLADVAAGIQSVTGEATDLNTVSTALGKALSTGAGALTRYGISLTDAQKSAFDASEGMERVRLLSEILDSNFRGLAAATVNPFTQAENAIGDLKEALGGELRPELENTARQFTAFIQDERTITFAQNVGKALVEFGQGVIRFFQFSIPIAMNRLKSTVANVSADVVENLGKLDPRRLFGGENPFLGLAENMRESATASSEMVEQLKQQELEQSAALIQAQVLAEANRDLAASYTEVSTAQGGSGSAPVRPGIAVVEQEDLFIDPLGELPELTEQSREAIALLVEEILGVPLAFDEVNESTKTAQKSFKAYTTGSITNLKELMGAVESFMMQFIQAKLNEAMAGAAAHEFSTKGLLGGITTGIAMGVVRAIFSQFPGFADGVTGFGGGLALVGERGPELVSLGQGSNVITNENTQRIIRRIDSIPSPGSPNVNVNNSGVENAIERLGDRIEQMQIQIDYFGLNDGLDRHNKQQRLIGNTS